MRQKLFSFCKRSWIVCLEVTAVFFLLFAFIAALFVWRLSSGPVDLAFAKNYIENSLSEIDPQYNVKFESVVLEWPDLKGPLLLDVRNIRLYTDLDKQLISVERADLGLSMRHLLIGRVQPISIILDEPSLQLVRQSGNIDILLEDEVLDENSETYGPKPKTDIRKEVTAFFEQIVSPSHDSDLLAAFERFEIRDARLVMRDHQIGVSWYLTNMDFALEREKEAASVSLDLELPGGPTGAAPVSIDLIYNEKAKTYSLTGLLQDVNPSIFAKLIPDAMNIASQDVALNVQLQAQFDERLLPVSGSAAVTIPEAFVDFPQEYDTPVSFKNISMDMVYEENALKISSLAGLFQGVSFDAQSIITFDEKRIDIPLTIKVPDLPLSQVEALFPKSEKDGEAAKWLIYKMSGGRIYDSTVDIALHAVKEKKADDIEEWVFNAPLPKVSFQFENVDVQYNDTLMPVKGAVGSGTLENNILEINGESAKIGDIDGRNAKIKITDLNVVGGGYATITADAAGPLKTALEYVSDEPIDFGDKLGFSIEDVRGNADLSVELNFPTVKDLPKKEVKVKIKGTLNNIAVPDVVKGLTLSGGPYKLDAKDGAFTLKGNGQLAGRDVTLDWKQYFDSEGQEFSAQIKAKIVADKELRHSFGIDLDEWLGGSVPVDVVYTDKGDDTAMVAVTGDLAPALITIEPFAYLKPSGVPGNLRLDAYLRDDTLKEIRDLSLQTSGFSLSDTRLVFRPRGGIDADLTQGRVSSAVLGRTSMSVDFEIMDNGVLKVSAQGPVLDALPFLDADENKDAQAKKTGDATPMIISVSAGKILMKNDQQMSNAKLYLELDTDGDLTRIEMDAKAGQGDVYVRFRPDAAGKRTFHMEADDAGAFLSALALYDNVRGGKIVIYGEPKARKLDGDLRGIARMENFRIVQAPVLAQLLGAMSLNGVQQVLGNEGVVFSKFEAQFEWLFKDGGSVLLIQDGRTSGSSLGLTFKGDVDRRTNQTDITGTIIPVSGVNKMLGDIPVIGDILTGGSGIIAATYSMKGSSDNPKISVNPLSVLTPGILRKILFEGGFEGEAPVRPASLSRTANE